LDFGKKSKGIASPRQKKFSKKQDSVYFVKQQLETRTDGCLNIKNSRLTISKLAPERKKTESAKPQTVATVKKTELNEDIWQSMLEDLRSTHNTLYSVLRMSTFNSDSLSDGVINLEFAFPFHQKRMSDSKNQQVILEKLSARGCEGYEIVCMVNNNQPKNTENNNSFATVAANSAQSDAENSTINNIKDIFGSVEVLE
jgi:hypothetical protein